MKKWKKVVLLAFGIPLLVVLCLFISNWIHYRNHYSYKGEFDPAINRKIVDFFDELSQGFGYVEAAGYPGGLGVYPSSGGIIFSASSEIQDLSEAILFHFPRNWDCPNRDDSVFGDFVEYDGVVPACFSLMGSEVGSQTELRTTYRLGENEEFDQAFVKFVEALGTEELLARDWGGAHKTLTGIRKKLEESKEPGWSRRITQEAEQIAAPNP